MKHGQHKAGKPPLIQEIGRSSTIMEARGRIGACGIPHTGQSAGAAHTYIVVPLRGCPTCARLPHGQWPRAWSDMSNQSCRIRLAMYGHPDARTNTRCE